MHEDDFTFLARVGNTFTVVSPSRCPSSLLRAAGQPLGATSAWEMRGQLDGQEGIDVG